MNEHSPTPTLLVDMGRKAKEAAAVIAMLPTHQKNKVLLDCAALLPQHIPHILAENAKDVAAAEAAGVKKAYLDRLTLTESRMQAIAEGLQQVAALPDPTNEAVMTKRLGNGLNITQRRVPMGVIGIIYEARPNVTADAFSLCFKAGSAVLLRGGKEALRSNMALVQVFEEALAQNGLPPHAVQLLQDTSRETATAFMRMNGYMDVLIPRGSDRLIQSVMANSTVPVIETGIGNCHIFVDATADFEKAVNIVLNAKVQRPGVCNACEKLLVHQDIAPTFLPLVCEALQNHGVEIRGDAQAQSFYPAIIPATEADWPTEYLDTIIAVKVVESLEDAMAHITRYSSGHSEAIITESYSNSQTFLNVIDAACVYVNASTRFTDGFEFGFGAEIGISTQKLHARGPMGLQALTSTKYVITGDGHVRN